jgi:hypothetical protein
MQLLLAVLFISLAIFLITIESAWYVAFNTCWSKAMLSKLIHGSKTCTSLIVDLLFIIFGKVKDCELLIMWEMYDCSVIVLI